MFTDKKDPKVVEYVSAVREMQKKAAAGELYIKFIDGNRKGSIARVVPNKRVYGADAIRPVKIEESWGWIEAQADRGAGYRIKDDRFHVIANWDKRNNKAQFDLPSEDIIFLPNYSGPTVWELFDSKAAKENVLKNPMQKDIDGKLLKVGDKVLYVNARYGSGMSLNHGTIKEFKVVVNSKHTEISTVVARDTDKLLSTISDSSQMIYKKPL